MTARQFHLTTTYDLFMSRYEVLKPLIAFARSNQPYVFDNNLELMSVFSDLINTEQGTAIVRRWYGIFEDALTDLERLAPIVSYVDERLVSLAYHTACTAIDTLATKLTRVIFQS
jgi:hypothetical protein